jgi:hypothetical protein
MDVKLHEVHYESKRMEATVLQSRERARIITADHVVRFKGCHMVRMLLGFPSIEVTWSTCESLGHIGAVVASMPRDSYCDMYRVMHFTDDWDLEDDTESWDSVFGDVKYEPLPDFARHRRKFEHVEDAFNKRWKQCVIFGRWVAKTYLA